MSDILVIGGGIAGISVAARLAPHAEVTLIEAEDALGYHASGRSAAVFEEHYGAPTVQTLSRAGRAYFEAGGYLSPRGLMLLARAGEEAAFKADCKALQCDPISVEAALARVPILSPEITQAAWHAEAEDIDTDRLIQDFARTLRAHGGQIVTKARVQSIARKGASWHVHTSVGSFQAAILINAAGAWADQIAGMAGIAPIGLNPCRRSMARIAAPGGHDVSAWPIFFGPGESWYAKPDAGALIVSPAEEDPSTPHDAWADDMVLAQGLARYQDFVLPPVTKPLSTWAGLRTFAPDRTLVLGPDPEVPSFVWCAGQGGYGFQTAPAASALLADLVLGKAPQLGLDIANALRPKRFR